MRVTVESPIELKPEVQAQLQTKLQQIFDTDVEMVVQTNPGLIGGLRITTPDKVADLSLVTKLTQLNRQLINAN